MFDVFYWGTKPNLFEFEKPADNLDHAAEQSRTGYYWYIYGDNDYTGFDFDYKPVPWESQYLHVWPSQWQQNGGVYLANAATVKERQWHYHTDQKVKSLGRVTDIFYVDHGNPMAEEQYQFLVADYPNLKRTRFVDNYLDTFKRIVNSTNTEYVWIINSVCDYRGFDFSWHPAQWQEEMIHCFPSDNQKRADTFYIHIESFKRQMIDLELLDWFNVINYCDDQQVFRWDTPIHLYTGDDLVTEIKNYDFETPYVLFTNQDSINLYNNPCLWSRKDRTVQRFTRSGATVAVPRDIKAHLKTQIYDYPYVEVSKTQVNEYYVDKDFPGLDIVYISNGEPDEERWYNHLCYMSNNDHIEWVRGVNGRTAAYQEAARRSRTPWFFAVFAKLEVLGSEFPWYTWMPDYFQEPKHYIFNSRNPVNGLEYGHMSVIAYNKNLVLSHDIPGIDFTLSQPHEHVPILSGIAHFNQNPIMTWRTAFRETLKLKHFNTITPTVETEHRLNVWLSTAQGDYAEWCLKGSNDAMEYYKQVNGDYNKLLYSFEWKWLNEYFNNKY